MAGPVRTRRPVYVDLLPPCNAGCPAGENIQAWLAELAAGRTERAWRTLVAENPLPAIHGRVCYHPCESVCNRAELDDAVSIHAVERYLGDLALERGWQFAPAAPPSGKRVLVVGSGPSGLSAAYHLAVRGHEVEIRDAGDQPGGMMRYGIPSYRLPRAVRAASMAVFPPPYTATFLPIRGRSPEATLRRKVIASTIRPASRAGMSTRLER